MCFASSCCFHEHLEPHAALLFNQQLDLSLVASLRRKVGRVQFGRMNRIEKIAVPYAVTAHRILFHLSLDFSHSFSLYLSLPLFRRVYVEPGVARTTNAVWNRGKIHRSPCGRAGGLGYALEGPSSGSIRLEPNVYPPYTVTVKSMFADICLSAGSGFVVLFSLRFLDFG